MPYSWGERLAAVACTGADVSMRLYTVAKLYYRCFNFIMEEKMSDCIDKLQNEIDELKKDHKKLMSGSERGSSSSSSSSSSGSERKESRSGSKKSSSKK